MELKFENIKDLAKCLIKEEKWSVACKYEYAVELIEQLIHAGKLICDIEIAPPEMNGYDKEYYVALIDEEIFCQKAYIDGRYGIAEECLVHEECNSAILKVIRLPLMFSITEYDEDPVNCEECPDKFECDDYKEQKVSKPRDDSINYYMVNDECHGFSYEKKTENGYVTKSYYTSDIIDKSSVPELMKGLF